MKKHNTAGYDHHLSVPLTGLLTVGERSVKSIQLKVNTDLTEQFGPGSELADGDRHFLQTVSDAQGNPITFYVKDDYSELNVLFKSQTYLPGQVQWKELKILPETICGTSGLSVKSLNVVALGDCRFNVNIALYDESSDTSLIFHSGYISNAIDNDATFEEKLSSWEALNEVPGTVIDMIIGDSLIDDDEGFGNMKLISAKKDGDISHYFWVSEDFDSEKGGEWTNFELPVQGSELNKMCAGRNIDGWGVYTLTTKERQQSLWFTALVDEDGPMRPAATNFKIPSGFAGDLEVSASVNGFTDLLIGGSGVHCIDSEMQEEMASQEIEPICLAKQEEIGNVNQLKVSKQGGKINLYSVNSDRQLFRFERPEKARLFLAANASETWGAPININDDVKEIALIKNDQVERDSFMYLGDNNYINRLSQSTSGWTSKNIPMPHEKEIRKFTCYSTNIHVCDDSDNPMTLAYQANADLELMKENPEPEKFELRAEEDVEVIINGQEHLIGKNKAALVHPDPFGNISIINRVDSLESPLYYISGGGMAEEITVNPCEKLEKKIQGYETKDSLLNDLKDSNGDSIVTKKENAEHVFDAVQGLQSVGEKLKAEAFNEPYTVSDNTVTCWGIRFDNGVASYHEHKEGVARMLALGNQPSQGILDAVWAVASDVLKWCKDKIEEVRHFVVELIDDAWHFAVDLAGQMYRFTIDSLTKVYSVFKQLIVKGLGVVWEKLCQWIGAFLNWDDVVTTYKVYSNAARKSFDFACAKLDDLETEALKVTGKLKEMISFVEAKSEEFMKKTIHGCIDDGNRQIPEKNRHFQSAVNNSPLGNFTKNQIMNSGLVGFDNRNQVFMAHNGPGAFLVGTNLMTNQEALFAVSGDSSEETIKGYLKKVADWFSDYVEEYNENLSEVVKLAEGKDVDMITLLNQLVFGTMKNLIRVAEDVLHALKVILQLVLKLIREIVDIDLRDPFLNTLFRTIVKVDDPNDKLGIASPLNVMIFLFAVPSVYSFKLIARRAPFSDEKGKVNTKGLEKMDQAQLFSVFEKKEGYTQQLTDYRNLSALSTGFVDSIDSGMILMFRLAEMEPPSVLSIPFSLSKLTYTFPIGKMSIGNVGGWMVRWVSLAGNIAGIFSQGPSNPAIASGKILLATVKVFYDVYAVIKKIIDYNSSGLSDAEKVVYTIEGYWEYCGQLLAFSSKAVSNSAAFAKTAETKAGLAVAGAALVSGEALVRTGLGVFRVGFNRCPFELL